MDAINIYGIMVIYNKTLNGSKAYECLKGRGIRLIVCDNSTVDNANAALAAVDGNDYISMNGNKGLSCAYNKGLEYIFQKYEPAPSDLICLFDDDTVISDDYFECIKRARGDILLPVVTDGTGIMSPVLMKKNVARRIKSRDALFKAEPGLLSGINSAMAVRSRIYAEYRYNEEMFLDYIDHMFIMDMRKKGKHPEVIDVDIRQQFSAIDDSKEAAVARFALQKKDLQIFYRDNHAMYLYVVIKKHIKLVLKYKDIRLLFS